MAASVAVVDGAGSRSEDHAVDNDTDGRTCVNSSRLVLSPPPPRNGSSRTFDSSFAYKSCRSTIASSPLACIARLQDVADTPKSSLHELSVGSPRREADGPQEFRLRALTLPHPPRDIATTDATEATAATRDGILLCPLIRFKRLWESQGERFARDNFKFIISFVLPERYSTCFYAL